jgi:uncharacterized membrane protein
LQFVAMTLMADMPTARVDPQASNAFGTPNVVHFGAVLMLSAILSAPWNGLAVVAILWGAMGLIGVVYALVVSRRMRTQTAYKPVFEDWLFHLLLPLIAYATLVGSACVAYAHARPALFIVGAVGLLLLFIGIHNTWDTVTYQIFVRKREQQDKERKS